MSAVVEAQRLNHQVGLAKALLGGVSCKQWWEVSTQ